MSGSAASRRSSQLVSSYLLSTAALLALGACRVDDQAFQDRVFRCDTSAADPLCGTDAQGNALQCFAARQIGASDFCAQQCEGDPRPLPDQGAVCVQGNAKLKSCDPRNDDDKSAHPQGACDRPEFGCLRTDVLADEGVCLTMNPCLTDKDCHDPVRSVCAATFLKKLYAGNDSLHADHLYCLEEGCQAKRTSCSPGETCLREVIPAGANPPDICVPNCDSNLRCPPNHFCLQKISGPGNPAVCIPGLLGFVCDTDLDCLVGQCMDDGGTGPGNDDHLHLCSTACASDADCEKFDSAQGRFVCADGRCATPDAYRGASCYTDADCVRDADSKCMRFAVTDAQGTCLHACGDNGSCRPRGGINQTCLPLRGETGTEPPVCFPGYFSFPCFDDASCVGDLSCRGVDLTGPEPRAGLCTALCAVDDDCAKNRWTPGGWCGYPDAPVCLPGRDAGEDCLRDPMCSSGLCGDDHKCQ